MPDDINHLLPSFDKDVPMDRVILFLVDKITALESVRSAGQTVIEDLLNINREGSPNAILTLNNKVKELEAWKAKIEPNIPVRAINANATKIEVVRVKVKELESQLSADTDEFKVECLKGMCPCDYLDETFCINKQEWMFCSLLVKIEELEAWKSEHYNAIHKKSINNRFEELEGVLSQLIQEALKWDKFGLKYMDIEALRKLLSDLDKARQGNSNPCIECLHEDEDCTIDGNCNFEAKSGKRDGARPNCDNCEYLKIKNPHCMECHDFSHWRQQKKPPTPTLEELSMDKEFIEKVNRYLHLSDQTIIDVPKVEQKKPNTPKSVKKLIEEGKFNENHGNPDEQGNYPKKPPLLYRYKKYWVRKSKVVAHLNEIINEWMEQQDDDNVPYLILSDMIEAYINELSEGLE